MKENRLKKSNAKQIDISKLYAGQRVDNFLLRFFSTLPKSRIYQMIRKGEVRANKRRIKPTYRLKEGDNIRVPPVYQDSINKLKPAQFHQNLIQESILFENNDVIVLNKPSRLSVHGGTAQKYGVIEIIRSIRRDFASLELVHRLDKDTSGCLLLAKSLPIARALNFLFKSGDIKKKYVALLAMRLDCDKRIITSPLRKYKKQGKAHWVKIDKTGKKTTTIITKKQCFNAATLVDIEPITGRTHQIRVHAASIGHPVIGDEKYGDRLFNLEFKKKGLRRLFLHARSIEFIAPSSQQKISVVAPLSRDLVASLEKIDQ